MWSEPTELDRGGRPEDALLAALDDAAAYHSRIAGSVRVIAARKPTREVRLELRRILAAIEGAKEAHRLVREAHRKGK